MFCNSGRIPFEEFFKSLIDKKDPARRLGRNLLANVRQDYILPILARVVKDERPNYETSDLLRKIWNTEEVWVKLSFWKPIHLFISKWDREAVCKREVDKVLDLLAPGLVQDHHKTLS